MKLMERGKQIGRALARLALVGVAATALAQAPPAQAADAEIIIRATGPEPSVLQAMTGQRVNFVKAVNDPVHVEFGMDRRQHQVVQIPTTGPIWATFHRPGTHPYVVHIYGTKTTTALRGLVEVVDDPREPWRRGTCGVVVMGDCIEP